jgi:hypothetical protein
LSRIGTLRLAVSYCGVPDLAGDWCHDCGILECIQEGFARRIWNGRLCDQCHDIGRHELADVGCIEDQ